MGEDDGGYFYGVAGDELDDVGGEAGFKEDTVDEVVGSDGRRGGFPDDDVAHEGGRAREVAAYGGEVEGGNGVDEAFERSIFDTVPDSRGIMDGLLCV